MVSLDDADPIPVLFSGTNDHILQWHFEYGSVTDTFDLKQTTSFEMITRNSGSFLIAASRDSVIRIVDINKKEKQFPAIKIEHGIIENMDTKKVDGQLLLAAGLENGSTF